jgi:homogentisate 1,2-dioxygenase
MGLLYGEYGGRSDGFEPGGASYETGFCPHGGISPAKASSLIKLMVVRLQYHTKCSRWPQSLN